MHALDMFPKKRLLPGTIYGSMSSPMVSMALQVFSVIKMAQTKRDDICIYAIIGLISHGRCFKRNIPGDETGTGTRRKPKSGAAVSRAR
jgi:hypothetical protein